MTTGRINQVAVTRAAAAKRRREVAVGRAAAHSGARTQARESSHADAGTTMERRNAAETGQRASAPDRCATAEDYDRGGEALHPSTSGPRTTVGGRSTRRAAIFHSRSEFPFRDPNLQDGRVGKVITP